MHSDFCFTFTQYLEVLCWSLGPFGCFAKAAEPPVPEAQFNLGLMLQTGQGTQSQKGHDMGQTWGWSLWNSGGEVSFCWLQLGCLSLWSNWRHRRWSASEQEEGLSVLLGSCQIWRLSCYEQYRLHAPGWRWSWGKQGGSLGVVFEGCKGRRYGRTVSPWRCLEAFRTMEEIALILIALILIRIVVRYHYDYDR